MHTWRQLDNEDATWWRKQTSLLPSQPAADAVRAAAAVFTPRLLLLGDQLEAHELTKLTHPRLYNTSIRGSDAHVFVATTLAIRELHQASTPLLIASSSHGAPIIVKTRPDALLNATGVASAVEEVAAFGPSRLVLVGCAVPVPRFLGPKFRNRVSDLNYVTTVPVLDRLMRTYDPLTCISESALQRETRFLPLVDTCFFRWLRQEGVHVLWRDLGPITIVRPDGSTLQRRCVTA